MEEEKNLPFWRDILGHGEEIGRLRKAAAARLLPHALIFTGPEGVGKRKVAFALAATILCSEEDAPCGKCPSCKALAAMSHPDYYELEPEIRGKSTRLIRIDEVRVLRLEAVRRPTLSKSRVMLIDGVNCMNEQAQNSFLKILEEPPEFTRFLLITSRPAALLDTVRSRSTQVTFGGLDEKAVASVLEQRSIASAKELAAMSEGSIGRALYLAENGGLERRERLLKFLSELKDMKLLALLKKGEELGKSPREELVEELRELFLLLRDILAKKIGFGGRLYHPDKEAEIFGLGGDFSRAEILSLLEIVRESKARLMYNVNLRLFAEGFLLKMHRALYSRS